MGLVTRQHQTIFESLMIVCHLSSHHKSRSVRIFFKQCRSLQRRGYQVSYVVPNERDEEVDGVSILGVRRASGVFGRLVVNPLRVFRRGWKVGADVYHFHDPELIIFALLLRAAGKKVIYDVHEDLPSRVKELKWTRSGLVRGLASNLVDFYETAAAASFSRIVAVNDSIAARFAPEKTSIVTNLPIVGLIDEQKAFQKEKCKPVIVYAGLLSRIRGIREVVEAMALVGDRAELWLFGDWNEKRLLAECQDSSGWQHTRYFGKVRLDEVYSYVKAADIGVVNFLPAENHYFSMPNKAFEYITCAKPMIMSAFPYWQEKFAGCALFVDPQDPADIAEKLSLLLDAPSLREEMGRKGRELIMNEYSWEAESLKLTAIYEGLQHALPSKRRPTEVLS